MAANIINTQKTITVSRSTVEVERVEPGANKIDNQETLNYSSKLKGDRTSTMIIRTTSASGKHKYKNK